MRLHIMFTHGQHAVTLDGTEAVQLLEEFEKANRKKTVRLRDWSLALDQICHIRIDPDE